MLLKSVSPVLFSGRRRGTISHKDAQALAMNRLQYEGQSYTAIGWNRTEAHPELHLQKERQAIRFLLQQREIYREYTRAGILPYSIDVTTLPIDSHVGYLFGRQFSDALKSGRPIMLKNMPRTNVSALYDPIQKSIFLMPAKDVESDLIPNHGHIPQCAEAFLNDKDCVARFDFKDMRTPSYMAQAHFSLIQRAFR